MRTLTRYDKWAAAAASFRMRFDNIDVNGIDRNVKDKYGDTPFHFNDQSGSIPFCFVYGHENLSFY